MGSGEVVVMTYWRRKSAAEKNALKRLDAIVDRQLSHIDALDAHRASNKKYDINEIGAVKNRYQKRTTPEICIRCKVRPRKSTHGNCKYCFICEADAYAERKIKHAKQHKCQ